jgi:hypothetical protein
MVLAFVFQSFTLPFSPFCVRSAQRGELRQRSMYSAVLLGIGVRARVM